MKTRRETRYRVEYRSFGIWRKMDTFGTQDEAYEYLQDQEYFDKKEGLPFTRYRVRKISVKVKFRNPVDYVFNWEYSPHGCYLFDDGTFGYIGDPEFDPEDFLEDGETEDDLIRDGRRPIGNIYIDRWDGSARSTDWQRRHPCDKPAWRRNRWSSLRWWKGSKCFHNHRWQEQQHGHRSVQSRQ